MKTFSPKSTQEGIVLLETLIAILIFSLGILGLVSLQANMIKNTGDSKYRSDANYIAQQRIGAMWADPSNISTYLEADTDISSRIPGGKRTVTQAAAGQYRITVGWTAPGETAATDVTAGPCFMLVAHCYSTTAVITGG